VGTTDGGYGLDKLLERSRLRPYPLLTNSTYVVLENGTEAPAADPDPSSAAAHAGPPPFFRPPPRCRDLTTDLERSVAWRDASGDGCDEYALQQPDWCRDNGRSYEHLGVREAFFYLVRFAICSALLEIHFSKILGICLTPRMKSSVQRFLDCLSNLSISVEGDSQHGVLRLRRGGH
jgi:hypothetical protein